MQELPSSPALFANFIREHVPPTFNVVAIGGNMCPPTRVEIHAGAIVLTIRWDGDAWVHDDADGSVLVLLRPAGVVALLHETFPDECV